MDMGVNAMAPLVSFLLDICRLGEALFDRLNRCCFRLLLFRFRDVVDRLDGDDGITFSEAKEQVSVYATVNPTSVCASKVTSFAANTQMEVIHVRWAYSAQRL